MFRSSISRLGCWIVDDLPKYSTNPLNLANPVDDLLVTDDLLRDFLLVLSKVSLYTLNAVEHSGVPPILLVVSIQLIKFAFLASRGVAVPELLEKLPAGVWKSSRIYTIR